MRITKLDGTVKPALVRVVRTSTDKLALGKNILLSSNHGNIGNKENNNVLVQKRLLLGDLALSPQNALHPLVGSGAMGKEKHRRLQTLLVGVLPF